MGWSITFGDEAERVGDIDPKLFLSLSRKNDLYWYEFFANPARFPDVAVDLARAVALAHEHPYDVSKYRLDTMDGLVEAFNDMYRWEDDDDLPKTSTSTGFPSTDDPTTEMSSGSSEPTDGNPTEHAA
jgi:hypothetical protein